MALEDRGLHLSERGESEDNDKDKRNQHCGSCQGAHSAGVTASGVDQADHEGQHCDDKQGSAATNAPGVEEAANAALRNRRRKQVVPGSGTPKHRQESFAGTSTATHSSDDFREPFDCMTSLARAQEGQSVLLHHTPCALNFSIAAL